MNRYKDAIYQYRQAGANLMVRRVEDKMASGGPAPTMGTPPSSPATQPRKKSKTDTAEFPKAEIHEQIRRIASDDALPRADQAAAFPGKTVQPVSESLLAESPTREPGPDTARYRVREETGPPPATGPFDVPAAPSDAGGGAPDPAAKTQRRAPEIFRFLENNLMEIDFAGK